MANQKDLFRAAIQPVVEEMRKSLDGHPGIEDLFSYLAGQVSDEKVDRLREHLSLCPSCCSLLLSAAAFQDVEEAADEQAAAWRQLQMRITPQPRGRYHESSLAALRLLAASFVLACLGLSIWVLSLKNRIEELSAPVLHVTLADVLPVGESLRGEPASEVQISETTRRVVLILHLIEPSTFTSYRVLFTDGPRAGWSTAGLRPDPEGYFALDVSREWLPPPPGRFRIELYGQKDRREALLATYSVQVESSSGGPWP